MLPVLLFLIKGSDGICAQRTEVEVFNANNGLPQTYVSCLILDSKGFLWIGTHSGLCLYDGYQFTTFSNNPLDSLSICNNFVKSIAEDKNGDIWVGTLAGLSRYERATGKFTNYFYEPANPASLAGDKIYYVYVDREKNLWVHTPGALNLYSYKTDSFTRFAYYNDLFTLPIETDIYPIYEDMQGRIWVGAKDGLMLFDRDRMLFKRYSSRASYPYALRGSRVQAIYEDSRGNFWVGTDNGLNLFNVKLQRFYPIAGLDGTDAVRFIFEDSGSTLLIGKESGVVRFCQSSGKVEPIQNFYNQNHEISPIGVSAILKDMSGITWIASRAGLLKINPFRQRFKGFDRDNLGNPLFSNNIIASIFEDSSGKLWVGTWGSGLHIFNPKTGANLRYCKKSSTYHLPDDFVHVVFQTSRGEIIVGTRNGVFVFDQESRQFSNFFASRHVRVGNIFDNNRVYSIDEDSAGNLWFATAVGLHCLSGNHLQSFYSHRGDSIFLPSNLIYDVLVGKQGEVWVATPNGLSRISDDSSNLINITVMTDSTGHGQQPLGEVYCLHQIANGAILAGTSNGLMSVNSLKGSKNLYFENPIIPSISVKAIEEDAKGNLWISTSKGITCYSPSIGQLASYTSDDGLLGNEFNLLSSFQSPSGILYFGGMQGISYFHPDSVKVNSHAPTLSFTKISLIGARDTKNVHPFGIDELKIPLGFSSLTIEFSALDFNHPQNNFYRYRLKGPSSSKWVELGNRHVITFTNLREGIYKLEVMGANSDKVWATEPLSLQIMVVAPFWRSRIAYIAYTLLTLSLLIAYATYRRNNSQRIKRLLAEREDVMAKLEIQKEELENKNKNITDSIHYAKRIQDAMLPTVDMFKSHLPNSFILFKPKDIVSGDFYWVKETDSKCFVAVVDCTGHGVPGAFMSIIGIELLRNITEVEAVEDAAEVLNRLSASVHETFSSVSYSNESGLKVKDGMDVTFCTFDKQYDIMQFSGAFSDLYIIRDGNIIEVKGDRFSVGMTDEAGRYMFSSSYIPLMPDDMIYLFTDGFVDQFGGPEGKKFKFRRFRRLLLNIYRLPLEAQQQMLEESITEWMGGQEQVDDILVIGIRVPIKAQ
jgi:ligand-binding sensor domain-containing protein/serine phosphatase RsbU (regulator of sigma subunit)